jgi:hypothetical protein
LTVDLVQASYDARRKLAPILNPSRTDPRAARGAGKKIIQYHGWADPLISAELSLTYFNAVQKALGDTQNFYLLFMVPGMGHCGGGVGPTWIMGAGVIHDAQHDAVNALTRWVEEGTAPDRIIATEFVMPALDPNVGPPLDPMVGPPAGQEHPSFVPLPEGCGLQSPRQHSRRGELRMQAAARARHSSAVYGAYFMTGYAASRR